MTLRPLVVSCSNSTIYKIENPILTKERNNYLKKKRLLHAHHPGERHPTMQLRLDLHLAWWSIFKVDIDYSSQVEKYDVFWESKQQKHNNVEDENQRICLLIKKERKGGKKGRKILKDSPSIPVTATIVSIGAKRLTIFKLLLSLDLSIVSSIIPLGVFILVAIVVISIFRLVLNPNFTPFIICSILAIPISSASLTIFWPRPFWPFAITWPWTVAAGTRTTSRTAWSLFIARFTPSSSSLAISWATATFTPLAISITTISVTVFFATGMTYIDVRSTTSSSP